MSDPQMDSPTVQDPTDSMLIDLVRLANELGVGTPLTLIVDGSIISGNLVSFEDYLRELADAVEKADAPEGVAVALARPYREDAEREKARREEIRAHLDRLKSDPAAVNDSDPIDDSLPSFIHFNNARLITGPVASSQLGLWRSRLTHVSGWRLGTIS